MIASEPTTPAGPAGGRGRAGSPGESSDQPLTILRGAGVDIDPRRARQWVVGVCMVLLFVVAMILLVAGIEKNSQADTLTNHGVAVNVKVTGCLGLLGGSGSNGAGYACKGTYIYQGRHYGKDIPGNSRLVPGSTIRGVIAPGDPGLLSTPAEVAAQQASWSVFVAPGVLFFVFVLTLVVLIVMRRRRQTTDSVVPA
jgi:hypothetical protein